jgi:hypothetical protein
MLYQRCEISNRALFMFRVLKRNTYISKFLFGICLLCSPWLTGENIFLFFSSFLHLKSHSKLYQKFQSEHLDSTNTFSINESYLGTKTLCPKNHLLHCQILLYHLIQRHLPAKNLSITGAPKREAERLQHPHPHKAKFKKHRFCRLYDIKSLSQPLKSNDD